MSSDPPDPPKPQFSFAAAMPKLGETGTKSKFTFGLGLGSKPAEPTKPQDPVPEAAKELPQVQANDGQDIDTGTNSVFSMPPLAKPQPKEPESKEFPPPISSLFSFDLPGLGKQAVESKPADAVREQPVAT